MSNLYYDKKREKRQSNNQLSRRGLFHGNIDLEALGIVQLIVEHEIDIDLYLPIDTGNTEIREDGKAYVIYEKKRKVSDPDTEFDIRRIMKDKVNARRDAIFVSGIDFSFAGSVHNLQTRNADDLINWTHVQKVAEKSPVDTVIELRVESNEDVPIPAGSVDALISAGVAYRRAIGKAASDLKDDIDDAATDDDAFAVYEAGIDTVWPNDSPIIL